MHKPFEALFFEEQQRERRMPSPAAVVQVSSRMMQLECASKVPSASFQHSCVCAFLSFLRFRPLATERPNVRPRMAHAEDGGASSRAKGGEEAPCPAATTAVGSPRGMRVPVGSWHEADMTPPLPDDVSCLSYSVSHDGPCVMNEPMCSLQSDFMTGWCVEFFTVPLSTMAVLENVMFFCVGFSTLKATQGHLIAIFGV